ncbi:glycosyltransferase family 2 protein [Shewanella sp.]|uniref:glycosyltransferase family 2 protein n=1 Tax=Shewanella sp. TaxID=50422 RepID=UPI003A981A6D
MKNNGSLALVTVLYNSDTVLPDFFESLARQTFKNFKLFVVDNSTSSSARDLCDVAAHKYNIDIDYIFNGENVGVAKGNNIGILKAISEKFDKVLLLNNDITFPENTFFDMLAQSANYNEKIFVPKIYFHGTDTLWMAGGSMSLWTARTPHRGEGETDVGQYEQSDIVSYAPTCFMLIDSVVFDAVGIMDEKYFVYYDDSDFIYRCVSKGFLVRYLPKITVTHKVSALTGGNESPFSVFYANRNRLYFIRKNLTGLKRLVAILYFFATRMLCSFKQSSKINGVVFRAILASRNMSKM